MKDRTELTRRRLAALFVALLGLFLLGLDLSPRSGPRGELLMVWSFFQADAGSGIGSWLPRAQSIGAFADALSGRLLPWMSLGLAASVVLGLATASVVAVRLSRRASFGMRAACVAAWATALDPSVALFVATRDALSASRYIDVGDLFRALGLGACWIAWMFWRRADAGTTLGVANPSGPGLSPIPNGPGIASSSERSVHEHSSVSEHTPLARRMDLSSGSERPGWSLVCAMLVAALLPSFVSWLALDRWPLTNDEHAYLFQARLFADGQLYRDLGGIADFFPSPQTVIEQGRLFLFTLPGHAAVLTPGTWLAWPELLPRLLAMLAVGLTWSLGVRLRVARPTWAAWCLALSPAFLGVESLYLSHATSLPCALLFAWCSLKAIDESSAGWRSRTLALAALAGFAFSIALVTRPVTALALAVPVILLLFRERPRSYGALVGAAVLGALPLTLWLLSVNHTLTGSAWQTAYSAFDRAGNAVYGVIDARTAASISAFNLARMSMWLCGVAPSLLLPVLGYGFAERGPRMGFIAAIPVSLFAFYVLHPFHGIPWVGPVYLSDSLPALALLTAQGLLVIEHAFGRTLRRGLCAIAVAGCALLLTHHFRLGHEEIELRRRPYLAALERGITNGVVFVRMDTLRERRLYPLHPPEHGDALVFARDLGSRNVELLRALGGPPAWIYDPVTGTLNQR